MRGSTGGNLIDTFRRPIRCRGEQFAGLGGAFVELCDQRLRPAQRFVGRLREQLPAYTIAEQMAPDGASFSLRMSLAAPLADAVDPELDADEEDA